MLAILLISSYRIAAFLLSLTPVVINLMMPGDIVTSIILAPLASLILAVFFIYGEQALLAFNCQCGQLKVTAEKVIADKFKQLPARQSLSQDYMTTLPHCCRHH